MVDLHLRKNSDAFRYEAWHGAELASQIDYRIDNNVMTITHTGTPPRFRHQGIAGALTAFMMDDARENHIRVKALCPYTAAWIHRHPEYQQISA